MKFSIGHSTIQLIANRFRNGQTGESGCCFGYAISVRQRGKDDAPDTVRNAARLVRLVKRGNRLQVQTMSRKQQLQKIV